MNTKQRCEMERLNRVQEFCEEIASQFTNTPPQPGDVKFQQKRTHVAALANAIGQHHVRQAAGTYSQASTHQAKERHDLYVLMRQVRDTVEAIAEETHQPDLLDRFRVPYSCSDAMLVARARAFAGAIVELALADEFEAHGFRQDVVEALQEDVEALLDSEESQGQALGNQAGATATLPTLLREARSVVKTLSVIMEQRFADDTDYLTRWFTASYVTKSPSTPRPAATAAPQA